MSYERNLEENLFNLQRDLLGGTYKHDSYTPFIVRDPKERQIHKATARDRIVHQAIFNIIEPIFERRFVYDSFSCRKNKGTHAASYRLRKFLVKASRNDTRTVYGLKCDIKKFFDSIDHEVLLAFLEKLIVDDRAVALLLRIISSFEKKPGKGLPLGNLTSQLFANIYLHEFDFFVKHELRIKWYLRYCDDFIIASESRKYTLALLEIMREFLRDRLRLEIHPNKTSISTWRRGIDFVGYVHFPRHNVLRIKTRNRMIERVNEANLTSYLGLCKHADTFELRRVMLSKTGQQEEY